MSAFGLPNRGLSPIVSSVPTFFRGERPEMAIAEGMFHSERVQAVDLLGLFQTSSNSGFVEFHRDYGQA